MCVCGRRVLEMCCFMEKMLASMLADFEMKVEKEVLEPLNKLSEVRMADGKPHANRPVCRCRCNESCTTSVSERTRREDLFLLSVGSSRCHLSPCVIGHLWS